MIYTGTSVPLTPRVWIGGTPPPIKGYVRTPKTSAAAYSFLIDTDDIVLLESTEVARKLLNRLGLEHHERPFADLDSIEGSRIYKAGDEELFAPSPE